MQSLLNVLSPFNQKQHEEFRYTLLTSMKKKGFSHYVNQLKTIQTRIITMENNNNMTDFLNDDYWIPLFDRKTAWWEKQEEFKWASNTYNSAFVKSASVFFSKQMLSTSSIDKLLGNVTYLTPQQIIFITELITQYYTGNKRLWPVTMNIEMGYLLYSGENHSFKQENFIKRDIMKLLMYLLSGSGPFMLKILQQVANKADDIKNSDVNWSEMTKNIFDAVPPLTKEEFVFVKENLSKTLSISHIHNKTIGSASLAETHSAKDAFGEDSIVKLIRPMYIIYFFCECDFLLVDLWKKIGDKIRASVVPQKKQDLLIKQTRQLLLYLVKEFSYEFDYEKESIYTSIGYETYNQPSLNLFSSQLIQFAVDPFPVIVQTQVGETSLKSLLTFWKSEQFTRSYPKDGKKLIQSVAPLLYRSLCNLFEVWVKNVFWGKNHFFHADLHTGNIRTLTFDRLVKLAAVSATNKKKQKQTAPLFVIDYGSAGILKKRVRCRLLTALLQTSNLVAMPRPPPQNIKEVDTEITREILPFYGKTPPTGLSVAVNNQQVLENHRKNIKESKKFVQLVYQLCEIEPHDANIDEISIYILKYNKPMTFSSLFLKLIRFGGEIGICTSNQMINFGRGIAYLNDTIELLCKECDPKDIEWFSINTVVKKELMLHPLQLFNLKTGKEIC